MILGDFLSRQTHDNSDLHDIIPISFNVHNTLHERYYKIETEEKYLVQMSLQTKSSGIKLPDVHGAKKIIDANVLPEKQKAISQIRQIIENKPRLGQERAGIRCRRPKLTENMTVSTNKSQEIPKIPTTQNVAKIEWTFQCENNQ